MTNGFAEREGHGVMDCPCCDIPILGSYSDLKRHVRDEHPHVLGEVDSDGRTVMDYITAAQERALAKDISREMVVSGDD